MQRPTEAPVVAASARMLGSPPIVMFHVLVLILVLAVSAAVFVLATGFRLPHPPGPAPGGDARPTPRPLGLPELERRAGGLLEKYGIAVASRAETGPDEVTLVGTSGDPLMGGRYIVVCAALAPGQPIPAARLLGFRDEVRAVGATKGLFLTDGLFPSDAETLLEDAPIVLLAMADPSDQAE